MDLIFGTSSNNLMASLMNKLVMNFGHVSGCALTPYGNFIDLVLS